MGMKIGNGGMEGWTIYQNVFLILFLFLFSPGCVFYLAIRQKWIKGTGEMYFFTILEIVVDR